MKQIVFITGLVVAASMLMVAAAPDRAQAQMQGDGQAREKPSFQALDTDGDGELTRDEIAAHAAARFGRADSDGDGRLSQDEITAQAQARAAGRAARMIARFDADGDGALSRGEMPGRLAGKFERIDRDASGGISRAEFADARAHAGGWMKRRSDKN